MRQHIPNRKNKMNPRQDNRTKTVLHRTDKTTNIQNPTIKFRQRRRYPKEAESSYGSTEWGSRLLGKLTLQIWSNGSPGPTSLSPRTSTYNHILKVDTLGKTSISKQKTTIVLLKHFLNLMDWACSLAWLCILLQKKFIPF